MPKVKRKTVAKSNTLARSKSNLRTKANPTAKTKAAADGNADLSIVFFCDPDSTGEGNFLSSWWRSRFEVKDIVYSQAGEHILAEKARAFGEKVSIEKERHLVEMVFQICLENTSDNPGRGHGRGIDTSGRQNSRC
jgi:hypothetical protein